MTIEKQTMKPINFQRNLKSKQKDVIETHSMVHKLTIVYILNIYIVNIIG